MGSKCGQCGIAVNRNNKSISCCKCNLLFHINCIDIPSETVCEIQKGALLYCCNNCKQKTNNDVSIVQLNNDNNECNNLNDKISDLICEVKKLKNKHHEVNDSLKVNNTEINSVFEKILSGFDEIKKSLSVIAQHNEKISNLETQNLSLKSDNMVLNKRLHYLERKYLSNYVELSNIPETKNENILDIINKVHQHLEVPLSNNDIINAYRHKRKNNNRPSTIVIKYSSEILRNKLLIANKLKKSLNLTILGFNQNTKIYVNELMTSLNKRLLYHVKVANKKLKYKFVWCKNNSIFMRKSNTSEIIKVSSMDSLNSIISMHNHTNQGNEEI